MKKLIIFGTGGCGREAIDTINRINSVKQTYQIIGFIDENEELCGTQINGIDVLGGDDRALELSQTNELYGVLAIASATVKRAIVRKMENLIVWENIIDPTACISPHAQIGQGNIIQPFVFLGSGVRIGNYCIINGSCVVGHDVTIEDYVSIMSCCNIAGYVKIKEAAYLGLGVSIIQNKIVGDSSTVGAGAVVINDIIAEGTYVGIPAKLLIK